VKADWVLRDAVNKTNADQVYMVYEMEAADAVQNWLHEGLSHECSHVWQRRFSDVLRPFKTRCGIHVTTHLDKRNDQLFNLVKVDTTCMWCISGKGKEE
jgi:hypothetical protein